MILLMCRAETKVSSSRCEALAVHWHSSRASSTIRSATFLPPDQDVSFILASPRLVEKPVDVWCSPLHIPSRKLTDHEIEIAKRFKQTTLVFIVGIGNVELFSQECPSVEPSSTIGDPFFYLKSDNERI